jgi:hypothetical protein
MDNKQSQLVMAQMFLIEAMLGSLMATHTNKEQLKAEFSYARSHFIEGMQKRGYSKDVVAIMEKRFGQMLDSLTEQQAPTQSLGPEPAKPC